jgi:ribulose-phosphate 3-epimerase
MADYLIAPSILLPILPACERVDVVLSAGADIVHFDVMDNHSRISPSGMVCTALRKYGIMIRCAFDGIRWISSSALLPSGRQLYHLHPDASTHRPFLAAYP